VLIDFAPLRNSEVKITEFSQRFTRDDLRAATNTYFDTILGIVKDATDAQFVFLPHDPHAHDAHAVPGEEHIGWSLAHLVVHVTASAEEGATYSSLLARGLVPAREPRPRYETHWKTVTTRSETLQRLAESRRICLAYLDTWPDQPHLDTRREVSQGFQDKFGGAPNAVASYLYGLMHLDSHLDQFGDVAQQARSAEHAVAGD